MFDYLLELTTQSLQDTFKCVNVHGENFLAIKYNNRIIGIVNSRHSCEIASPFLDDTPTSGILDSMKMALGSSIVPDSVKDIVMYARGLMVEV